MRPLFTVDTTGHLVSDITEAEMPIASGVSVGSAFSFDTPYATPWGDVPVGVEAFVTEVHNETGELDLEVRQVVPALFMWSNILIMIPFMSDDLSACLRLLT